MQTAIIGTGRLGTVIAQQFRDRGRSVLTASRHPQAGLVPIEAALDQASVVILAIPHGVAEAFLTTHQNPLRGKILVDATNNFYSREAQPTSQVLADLVPDTTVVKTLNTVHYQSFPQGKDQLWGMGYALDEEQSRGVIEQLVIDSGFTPVPVGSLAQSRILEPGSPLFNQTLTPDRIRAILASAYPA